MNPADTEARSRIRGWARVVAALWIIFFGAATLVVLRINPDNRIMWLGAATAALPGVIAAIWLSREPAPRSGGGAKQMD
ncbi:MAG TPA: hypothetical protein VIX59_13780 [Candidatus Binataceae bacterium]|jgi:hypothetical protein